MRDSAGPWFPRGRDELRVINPASGVGLSVWILAPRDAGPRPLLLLVPGVADGNLVFGVSGIADRLARRGYTVAYFDPDGRGASGGDEDFGGAIHQEGLAAVLATATELPSANPERVGLVSFSFGSMMAAGMLARHPELPVRLYVDWEGPALRQHALRILSTSDLAPTAVEPAPASDDGWWTEREAAPHLRQVAVPYQRVQNTPDHAQAHQDHARLMIQSATSTEHGGSGRSPWTRLNGLQPNRLYDSGFEPEWLPSVAAEVAVFTYLVELLPPT